MINSQLCCGLRQVVEKKRPGLNIRKCIVFHRDNYQPHTSLMTSNEFTGIVCEVLMHPPYIQDTL